MNEDIVEECHRLSAQEVNYLHHYMDEFYGSLTEENKEIGTFLHESDHAGRLLDVACGPSALYWAMFHPNVTHFCGIDAREDSITHLQSLLAEAANGKVEADVEVSMTNNGLACVSGNIPRSNIKWVLADVEYTHGTNTALTANAVDTNIYIGYGTNGTPTPTKTLFWNLMIPPDGVGGYCSSAVNVSTIIH